MDEIDKRIIIIQKDRIVSDLIRLALQRAGFKITVINKTSDINKILNREIPSLILLDIFFPGWDSIGFLQSIRRDKKFKDLKIIVISSLGFEEVVTNAIRLGANDFLVKPFETELLLEKVKITSFDLRKILLGDFTLSLVLLHQ